MNLLQRCEKLCKKLCLVVNKALFSEFVRDQIADRGLNLFFVGYTFSGGFLFDNNINEWFRRCWLIYDILSSVVILICSVFYLTDLLVFDYRGIVVGVSPILVISAKIMVFLAMYRYRREVTRMMKFFLDDECSESTDEGCSINVRKKAIAKIVAFLVLILILDVTFDPNAIIGLGKLTKRFHTIQYFATWCPYPDSTLMYYTIRVFKIAIMIPIFSVFLFCFTFNSMAIELTHNRFGILAGELESMSDRAFEELQKMDKFEEESLDSSRVISVWADKKVKRDRSRLMDAFFIDLVRCMKRYQQLRRMARSPKEYLEGYYSVIFAYIFVLSIFMGFIILMSLTKTNQTELSSGTMEAFGALCMQFMVLYDCCIQGHLFKETTEMVTELVYSIPWYHLNPERRKVVLTFLTLAQWPMELRVWKIVLLTKDVLPRYLNSIFSHVQIMITLQRKKFHY